MKPILFSVILGLSLVGVFFSNNAKAQDLQAMRKEQPFRIKGALSAGVWFYNANGITSRRSPFSWYLTGSPTISIYGMTFPFSMTVSEQDRRFAQPFNRYGVSPYYKWLTLHAGYRNVKFSDFTLGGVTMLGGGFEINPGKLRLGAMAGQINRAVAEDTTFKDPLGRSSFPIYRRMGYAFKLGVGTRNNFFDLLFFKGQDDKNSIARPTKNTRITPADNAVLGIKTHFTVLKALVFDADFAASIFTKNRFAKPIDKDNEDYAFLNTVGGLLDINTSSGLYKAGRASLTYGFGVGSVAAQYERIDQNFQSLGAFFFNNDNEQWTVAPSLSLFRNTVTVGGSYGIARDNLNGKKYATTFRSIGSVNLGVQILEKFNVGFNLSNFGTNQNRGVGEFFNDTTAISIVNNSYGFNVGYNDADEHRVLNVNLTAGYQDANDQNRFTRDLTAIQSSFANVSYTYSLVESQTTYTASVSYNDTKTPFQKIVTLGPVASVSRAFFDKKLRTTFSGTYFLRRSNELADGNTISAMGSASYLVKKHTFTISSNFLSNKANQATASFTELRTNLMYGYSF